MQGFFFGGFSLAICGTKGGKIVLPDQTLRRFVHFFCIQRVTPPCKLVVQQGLLGGALLIR